MMTIRRRISLALLLALTTMIFTASSVLAHATEGDPSLAHRVIDSALTPLLGLGVLGIASVVWWRRTRGHEL